MEFGSIFFIDPDRLILSEIFFNIGINVETENLIWFKGEVMPHSQALVNVMSPTSQFGLNVFEGLRGYWNNDKKKLYIFRFDDHISRLFESCKLLSLTSPYFKDEIWGFVNDLLTRQKFETDIAVRLTLFVDGSGSWHTLDTPDLFISPIVKLRKNPNNLSGFSACVSSWKRIDDSSMPPRVKAGANYVSGRYAHLEANKSGYDLPIFLNSKGTVAEGAGACIFIVRKNELITPTLQCSILESITRDTLIQLSRAMGLEVNEREINRSELLIADEIFLCGSAAEIAPITSVNNVLVGDGRPGPTTISLHEKYLQIVCNYHAQIPDTDWLRVVQ